MRRVEKYNPEKKEAWNRLIKSSKNGTFLFDRNYMDYHSDRFEDFSLMFFENQNLIAALPANIKDGFVYSHQGLTYGGMIYDDNMKSAEMLQIFSMMLDFLKLHNIQKLVYKAIPHIYHKMPAEEDLYALFRVGAKLYRRDLSTTIHQPTKMRFERGRRRCFEDAKKSGLVIKRSCDFERMYEIMKDILEKKYAVKPVHSAAEMKFLHDRFPENIHLYGCYKDEEMISGSLIFITEKTVHAQYVYASDEGRRKGANDLMYDFLINEKFCDFEYFDFGISTENGGLFLNENLVQQKEMFGGRAVCYDFYELNLI
jgi:hypothetical protein